MRTIYLIAIPVALLGLVGCKQDPLPYTNTSNNGWIYNGGDANVGDNQYVIIDFDINGNLNANGYAEIVTRSNIGGDLNLNDNGKVVINIPWQQDTVYVNGNVNLNDSLIVRDGVLRINGDFNINANGVVNVSDAGHIWIEGDVNNAGDLYGNRNTRKDGAFNQNGGSTTQEAPLY